MSRVCHHRYACQQRNGGILPYPHQKLQQANPTATSLVGGREPLGESADYHRALKTIQKKGLGAYAKSLGINLAKVEPSMPRTANRREFLGISLAGALAWFWKPQTARALGGKLPELGVAAPDFNSGTIGGTTTPNLSLDSWRQMAGALFLPERFHLRMHH